MVDGSLASGVAAPFFRRKRVAVRTQQTKTARFKAFQEQRLNPLSTRGFRKPKTHVPVGAEMERRESHPLPRLT
jgi:hypothetical protein